MISLLIGAVVAYSLNATALIVYLKYFFSVTDKKEKKMNYTSSCMCTSSNSLVSILKKAQGLIHQFYQKDFFSKSEIYISYAKDMIKRNFIH